MHAPRPEIQMCLGGHCQRNDDCVANDVYNLLFSHLLRRGRIGLRLGIGLLGGFFARWCPFFLLGRSIVSAWGR
eukprot:567306-Amorphochlora_amoeboformis.AAC.1